MRNISSNTIARAQTRQALIALLLLMFLLRSADCYITYLITPDLDQEWNPIVSIFGQSWPGLLLAQLILYVTAGSAAYYSLSHNTFLSYRDGLHYREFVYYHFNGRLDPAKKWISGFFGIPDIKSGSLAKHVAFLCFLYASTFITISIFAIVNNVLILLQIEPYMYFVDRYGNSYILSMFVLSIFINAQLYFYWGYRRYKHNAGL